MNWRPASGPAPCTSCCVRMGRCLAVPASNSARAVSSHTTGCRQSMPTIRMPGCAPSPLHVSPILYIHNPPPPTQLPMGCSPWLPPPATIRPPQPTTLPTMLSPLQIDALDPCALLMVIFAAVLGGFWLTFVVYRALPSHLPHALMHA